MNKIKSFNNFINENKNQNILDKFGEILFGEFRGTEEKDTKYESKVFNKLIEFVKGQSGKNLDKSFIKNLKELKKLKKEYPILQPIDLGNYYRGEKKDSIKNIDKIDFEWDKNYEMYKSKNQISYQPKSIVQSWTSDFNIAIMFGDFIIEADLKKDDMLFNFNFLNQISMQKGWEQIEDETIRISKRPLKAFVYTKNINKI